MDHQPSGKENTTLPFQSSLECDRNGPLWYSFPPLEDNEAAVGVWIEAKLWSRHDCVVIGGRWRVWRVPYRRGFRKQRREEVASSRVRSCWVRVLCSLYLPPQGAVSLGVQPRGTHRVMLELRGTVPILALMWWRECQSHCRHVSTEKLCPAVPTPDCQDPFSKSPCLVGRIEY